MLEWLKIKNNYPDFWKNYLDTFDKKSDRKIVISVLFDSENPENIQTIAGIAVKDNALIVKDSIEIIFDSNENELEKLQELTDFLKNAVLIGYRVDFDTEAINKKLNLNNCSNLKNEALDIEIMYRKLNDLSENYNVSITEMNQKFKIKETPFLSISDEVLNLGLIFLKLKTKLKIK